MFQFLELIVQRVVGGVERSTSHVTQVCCGEQSRGCFCRVGKAAKDVVMVLNSDIALKLPDQNLGLAFVRPAAGLVASHQWAKRA
jgi:hypothetical protein